MGKKLEYESVLKIVDKVIGRINERSMTKGLPPEAMDNFLRALELKVKILDRIEGDSDK